MSGVSTSAGSRRLNVRVLIVLGLAAAVLGGGFLALRSRGGRSSERALLEQARERWKAREHATALGYLNRYLELHPSDLDALDMKARFLAESAQNGPQAVEAMPLHVKVLSRDPSRQETRRRLLELNLKAPGRAKTAVELGRELIRRGADDAATHRLLAAALEKSVEEGDEKALDEACREYEAAERVEPGDVAAGEQLASLYAVKLKQPDKALEVLDRLLARNQKDPAKKAAARLARAHHFARLGLMDRAEAEVVQAVAAEPANPEVLISAAQIAASRGEAEDARRRLAAIPEAARNDLRVKLLEGMIELKERRPDEAVQSWRSGLVLNGGNDAALTWKLAQVLLEMGRVDEAEPLISQYRRLIGGEEPNAWCRYLQAFRLYKTGRPAQAVKELEAVAFKAEPALDPLLQLLLGQCYEAVRDEPKALAAYRKSTDLSHDLADPWLAIARIQLRKDPAAAADTVALGLRAMPTDPRLLAQSVNYLWQAEMRRPPAERTWKDVEQALDRAEKIAPNTMEMAEVRAGYLLSAGKADEALAVLDKAARHDPKFVPLWATRARTLSRLGRTDEALKTLAEAVVTAGPQAQFFIDRASILIGQGHAKEARATLLDALDRAPADQKAGLWKALGDYYSGQNDLASARAAYQEFARLDPANPQPHILLMDLAIAAADEDAIRVEFEALKTMGGPDSVNWRLVRVEDLLRKRPKDDDGARASRLEEAGRLVGEIQAAEPQYARGYLLEGRVKEQRGEADQAAKAYERAVDLGGGPIALASLVSLLVRGQRDAELDRVRKKETVPPNEFDRLAAVVALRAGDKGRAETMAARLAQSQPESLDVQLWQAEVLRGLGKSGDAEAALRRLTERQPTEQAPWLKLLTLQVAAGRTKEAAETVELIRKNVKADRPELLWAQCYRLAGDLPRADVQYREALRKWPDSQEVRLAVVGYCEQTSRQAEAEAMLRKVLERDPGYGLAARKLALLLASHRGDRAAWHEALRLIGPDDKPDDLPADRLTRAQVYFQGPEPRHRRQALAVLEKLAAEVPGMAAVHELTARVLLASGDLAGAREHAALAAASEGASRESVSLLAGVLLLSKDLDGAERELKRLEAVDPRGLPVVELKAKLLAARGKAAEAAELLEGACEGRLQSMRDVSTGEKMVGLMLELNLADAADRTVRKLGALGTTGKCLLARFLATRGDPKDEAPQLLQAAADAGDGRNAGMTALSLAARPKADPRWLALADRCLAQARKAEPDAPDLIEKQADVRRLQGRHADEVALYKTLLARRPADPLILNKLAWTLSEDLGDPKAGLVRADEALKASPGDPHLLDTRGVILTRLGRLDDAVRDLEAAAEALPGGELYFHLARACRKKGRDGDYRKYRDLARKAGLAADRLQPSERDEWAAETGR